MFEKEIEILKNFGIKAEVFMGDHLNIVGGRLSLYVYFDWHPDKGFYCNMHGTWADIEDLCEYQKGITKAISIFEALGIGKN